MLLVVLPFAFFVTLPQFGQSYSSMSVGNRYNKPFPKSIHINTNCLSHNLHSLYSVHRDTDEFESNKKDGTRRKKKIVEENIPGKTSAIPGAKDYEINIPQTEQKWFEQADDAERKVKEFTAKGMNALKLLRLDEAALAFDMVYRLNPNAYCWHYGIVLFYLGKYHEAAQLFSHNAKQCEFKFEIPASEERIWYSACCLKARGKGSFDGKQKRRKKSTDEVIAPLEENKDAIYETRKVIRIARDLFEASVMGDGSSVALARAQLHSVAVSGASPNSGIPRIAGTLGSNIDRKMWKLSAWYYLGLHYDSLGNEKESKKCIKMALRQCATSGNGVDGPYLHHFVIHPCCSFNMINLSAYNISFI
jgi:tetratricopeptide (TPR) repeat protein